MNSQPVKILLTFVVLIILGGVTFFTLSTFASAFGINESWTTVIYISSICTPLLFLLNFTFSQGRLGSASGMLYYPITNVAAGLLLFGFLGSCVAAIIEVISLELGYTQPSLDSIFILGLFICCYLIGLIQARLIKIVTYNVQLSNFPKSWNGKTAVLVTDTHFGLINYKKFSDKIVNKILSLSPDFVLHAGDFYDGPACRTEPITNSWKRITKEVPVFYAPGNHETYGPYPEFIQSIKDADIQVLLDDSVLYDGVRIAGITYRSRYQEESAEIAIKSIVKNDNVPVILINHVPLFRNHAAKAAHLMVSGHTHNGQFWPFSYIVKAIFGKYSYGMHTNGTLTTIISAGVGTAGPPTRFLRRPELVRIVFNT